MSEINNTLINGMAIYVVFMAVYGICTGELLL